MASIRGLERTEFPRKVKAAAFKRCCDASGQPRCETCGITLTAGNIIYEHDKADGLGGEPVLANCKVHCRTCADVKTHTRDNPIMKKADRSLKKAFGIAKTKGRPMPGSRASGWKRKMDGTMVRR